MESFSFMTALKIFGDLGTIGLVIFLWWQDSRRYAELLRQYKADMDEQRTMYVSNVSLVKDYHSVARDLSEVVIMATQTMTRLSEDVRQNQFCPLIRIDKKHVTIGERQHENIAGTGRNAGKTGGGGA